MIKKKSYFHLHVLFSISIFLGLSAFQLFAQDYFHEAWDDHNDPLKLDSQFVRDVRKLPGQGKMKNDIWVDSYWQANKGGIAYRWVKSSRYGSRDRLPFYYKTYSQAEVIRMSLDQRSLLSPAEKYDIYMGNFDYPTVAEERTRNDKSYPEWFGLCHGLAAASVNFPKEPKPINLKSSQGITIPFGSSDIKALLSYYQGYASKTKSRYLGTRCDIPRSSRDLEKLSECKDTNAGTFHVVLTNLLGMKGFPFAADMTRDIEVWNYPIISYQIKYLSKRPPSRDSAPGTAYEVRTQTKVEYTKDATASWYKSKTVTRTINFEYLLELDREHNIIGGTWISYDRPDFLWFQTKPEFTGYFKNIEQIYYQSVN